MQREKSLRRLLRAQRYIRELADIEVARGERLISVLDEEEVALLQRLSSSEGGANLFPDVVLRRLSTNAILRAGAEKALGSQKEKALKHIKIEKQLERATKRAESQRDLRESDREVSEILALCSRVRSDRPR